MKIQNNSNEIEIKHRNVPNNGSMSIHRNYMYQYEDFLRDINVSGLGPVYI